ncbi:MAG TPA: sigma-54 dependent transcriptional regulator [Spirochaetota bacterium]|nr:sigma-54 dependent transcriptional regulator [Spirochaetota bacterium]HPJ38177.1 sigma-54 dependent transcriptional regulator [Spirochaetota bacterium]HPQ51661.1 sigma-54 dependent transcriptional regulator [Spirochaetota bacterium]
MKPNYKILIADDEKGVRELLKDLLFPSFEVETIDRGDTIIEKLRSNLFDILILDLQLPGMYGIDVLRQIHENKINIAVVVITASNDIDNAITSMKLGAYDYIVKPFDTDKLLVILKNIVEKLDLENEVTILRKQIGENFRFNNIIGDSEPIRKIFSTLEKVIDTDSTILIIGDSGTGKEIIAKAIHYNSNRKQFPFRSIDCSTIPQDLIGSELFGHEKGSFTGAISRKIGKFEIASKGTLFLDEISNLSIDMQAKLLRVLQEKEFERIGGNQIIKVNTRIVAASNKDLRDLVKENLFREDLYYRLNVVPIYIPSLKDRKEDIPLFIDHFLNKYNLEYDRKLEIDLKARLFLTNYDWPGNVRQLENIIKRLVLLSTKKIVDISHIKQLLEFEETRQPGIIINDDSSKDDLMEVDEETVLIKSMDEMEKEHLEKALHHFNYNISITARNLKISRKTMHNKLKKYNIVIKKSAEIK